MIVLLLEASRTGSWIDDQLEASRTGSWIDDQLGASRTWSWIDDQLEASRTGSWIDDQLEASRTWSWIDDQLEAYHVEVYLIHHSFYVMEPCRVFQLGAFQNELCLDLAFWIWYEAFHLTVWIAMAVVLEVYRVVVVAAPVVCFIQRVSASSRVHFGLLDRPLSCCCLVPFFLTLVSSDGRDFYGGGICVGISGEGCGI